MEKLKQIPGKEIIPISELVFRNYEELEKDWKNGCWKLHENVDLLKIDIRSFNNYKNLEENIESFKKNALKIILEKIHESEGFSNNIF